MLSFFPSSFAAPIWFRLTRLPRLSPQRVASPRSTQSTRAISFPVIPLSTVRYSGPSRTNPPSAIVAASFVAAYGAILSATSALPSPSKSPVMNGVHQTPMFMFHPRS